MTLRGRLGRAAVDWMPRAVVVRRGRADLRRVALTFDDGPDHQTHEYLDVLDRLAVRATFFLVGDACVRRPHDVHAIVAHGHEVASHGFTHRPFPTLSRRDLESELSRCDEALPPTERRRALVRPPRGATSVRSLLQCATAGYQTVLWSLDSDDCRTKSPRDIATRVAASTPGEIVLLHEGQSWTLEALPLIVQGLRNEGLEPVTISELI